MNSSKITDQIDHLARELSALLLEIQNDGQEQLPDELSELKKLLDEIYYEDSSTSFPRDKTDLNLNHNVLLDYINDAIIVSDRNYNVTFWNKAAERIYGWAASEVLGRNGLEIIQTKFPDTDKHIMLQTIAEAGHWRGEVTQLRKDGTRFPVDINSIVIKDSNNEILSFISVNREISDRYEAQRKIADEKEWFRTSLTSIGDGVIATDQNALITFINPAAERITGWTCDEANGHPIRDVFTTHHEQSHQSDVNLIEQVLQTGESVYPIHQSVLITRDGRKVPIEDTAAPIKNEYQTIGVIIVFRDVTHQREVEQTLRESEERFHSLFNSMTEGFALHELIYESSGQPVDYRFLDINPAFERQTGLSRGEVVGKAIREIPRLRDNDPNWLEIFSKVVRTGDSIRFTNYSTPLNKHLELFAYTPAPNQFAVIFMDISQKIDLEKSLQANLANLRKSEARYRQLIELSPDAIFIQSGGKFAFINQAVLTLFHADHPKKIIGKNVLDFIHPDYQELVVTRMNRINVLRQQLPQIEEVFVRLDGTHVPVEIVAAPIIYKGKPGALVIARDITSRKTAEKAQREINQRIELQRRLIEQREQERQRIARDLHDGPVQDLTAVTYTLHMLAEETNDPTLSNILTNIRESLQQQVNELRAYSTGLRPPILASFGLSTAIISHADQFRSKYPEITLSIQVPKSEPELSETLRIVLYRIYQEAMNNIIKHAHASHIFISFHIDDNKAVIEIEDNGCGFTLPPNWLDFARQGHLGLVGIHERTEVVGGELEIDTSPGNGTRLSVMVPIMEYVV